MNKFKINKYAFTLVELIIVITILAILATIAFVSFQNYVKDSRDSNRITVLKNIETGLNTFQVNSGFFPEPDTKVSIFASGTLIGYQGNVGESMSKILKLNKIPFDPNTKQAYTYNTDTQKLSYSLVSLKENTNISYHQTYADSVNFKSSFVLGSNLGVLYSQNTPIEQTGTGVDIVNTNQIYTSVTKDNYITGTGGTLRVLTAGYNKLGNVSYAKSCKEIKEGGVANGNGIYSINPNLTSTGTFQVYCDMNTQGGGWHLISIVPGESTKFADRGIMGIWKSPIYDTQAPSEITNREYLSKSYQESTTNEILLCYKNTQMCYNFKHNMNIPLFNFYRDNLSYVDYSFNLYNYGNIGNSGSLANYYTTFGLPSTSFPGVCGFLGINARTASSSATTLIIGYGGDGDGPCISVNNVASNMDNEVLGLGFSLRYFSSLNYPGRPVVTAGAMGYNIPDSIKQPINTQYGFMDTYVSKNWFIMGR